MDEKERYLQTREREFATTIKVLNAYPGEGNLRPAEKLKSARDLAWSFATEEHMTLTLIETGEFPKTWPAIPATMRETIDGVKHQHDLVTKKISSMSVEDLNKKVKFFVAPKQLGDYRLMDILWMMQSDSIHHRGQFSVYIRLAGGKVPSIYGPTADEPWM